MLLDFRDTVRRWRQRSAYHRCPPNHGNLSLQTHYGGKQIMGSVCIAILSALGGALLVILLNGIQTRGDCTSHAFSNASIPVRIVDITLSYNESFAGDAMEDENSKAFWNSIVPLGRGTVEYPAGSHEFYTISAMHQLHCLWGLRQALYSVTRYNNTQEHDARHRRHCLDYLRQSLMCAADATLEPVDRDLGGVTGWGVPRRCRSYADLRDWAERRRASNAYGFED